MDLSAYKGKRVLVAMSGGVDSSVTALMLHKAGAEVIGVTMKTWDYDSSGSSTKTTGCCSLDDINDARAMSVKLGFPHLILDLRAEFGESVIDNFVQEYAAGRTPNPCILCNTFIKWDALLKRASQLDCEFIATGHYAKVKHDPNALIKYWIETGDDSTKDQSYVLWGLKQEDLARTILPLGDMTKTEIRKIALESGFESLASKSDSYEICFIPDNDYRSFLKRKNHSIANIDQGNFVDLEGKIIGTHEGYPFYTVGQRKGLGVTSGDKALYVKKIIPSTNTVVLCEQEHLGETKFTVRNINMMHADVSNRVYENVVCRVRHRDLGVMCDFNPQEGTVVAKSKTVAVSGQSVVFYDGSRVIGGGFIDKILS